VIIVCPLQKLLQHSFRTTSVPCMVLDTFHWTQPTKIYPVSTSGRYPLGTFSRIPLVDKGRGLCDGN